MIKGIQFIYFSPTGGTKAVGEMFCRALSVPVERIDLSKELFGRSLSAAKLTVVALPVFGGRIPGPAQEKLARLKGQGAPVVTLVVYGTRAYEDALRELNDTMMAADFTVVASAALIARHSMVPEVGAGRPDAGDEKEINRFAAQVKAQLAEGKNGGVTVPGDVPYKAEMNLAATPLTLPNCTKCGGCMAVCPTEAIMMEDGELVTEAEDCIFCMACISRCPVKARIMPPPMQEQMQEKLGPLRDLHRENEFFLAQ